MYMQTILAVALLLPCVTVAQINRCLDASGKVVAYAVECPSGTRSEQTSIRNAPAPASRQKSPSDLDADFRKRQTEKQEASMTAEKKAAEAAQRAFACENSRAYLRSLQERQRIARTDPKNGERVFLNDAEYPQEIAKTQRSISEHCN